MRLTMLGTGNAVARECYNTCFVLEEQGEYFLTDGGGGNGILKQLKLAGIKWQNIHNIFVTHRHMDHVMGILWLVRIICQGAQRGEYQGEVTIYAHQELVDIIYQMACMLMQEKDTKFIGECLHLVVVKDGEQKTILGHPVTFFDIGSTKAKQFGFTMEIGGGERLTCCGDEPYYEAERPYVENSKWLLHEAFCLYSQADRFNPYKKHHSTVKDACEVAEQLKVKNLILYHTEDVNILHRKELYLAEGKQYFSGSLYVPEDLETIEL